MSPSARERVPEQELQDEAVLGIRLGAAMFSDAAVRPEYHGSEPFFRERLPEERRPDARLIRDIFGNPFRPMTFDPSWLTTTAIALARRMYESGDFSAMPILADALRRAGCANADVLNHGRSDGPHVRGCWAVDAMLEKERTVTVA